ncbi:MAG: hypothetical protein CMO55_28645 [Verrucomicrobiales bacterium]|nr:hypothetical protein [Verrucomicrobiales bacterium]
MRDYFFEGIKRLDWGFNNPNITAGLIAILMMAVWILCRIHRWGFWPSLLGFTALGVCLIQTVSRGGMVAAFVGGLVMVVLAPRPWKKNRWLPIAVCLIGLLGYAFWHGVAKRYADGIVEEDGSVTNRWIIYRTTPAMMVDAPEGWGLKKASIAFHNFYQPEGRFERYGSLVSSHLTWMVEFSWLGRLGYVLGWMCVFLLCFPSRKRRWYEVGLAVWISFATAATFTTMANRWILWVVPAVFFTAVTVERIRLRDWPSMKGWGLPVVAAISVLIVIGVIGIWGSPSNPKVTNESGWVTIGKNGKGNNRIWIVDPDSEILGKAYGQRLRGLASLLDETENRSVAVQWEKIEPIPNRDDVVFLSGVGLQEVSAQRMDQLVNSERWILLNPDMPSEELVSRIELLPEVCIFWGEFNPGRSRYIWQSIAEKYKHVSFETVTAAGKYLPNWTELVYYENTEEPGS